MTVIIQTIDVEPASVPGMSGGAVVYAAMTLDGSAVVVKDSPTGAGDLQLVIDPATGKQKLVRPSDGTEVAI